MPAKPAQAHHSSACRVSAMAAITFELWPFQCEAINALYSHWNGEGCNPLVVAATGTGKSLMSHGLSGTSCNAGRTSGRDDPAPATIAEAFASAV
jgi:hypothetical protein